MKVGIVTLYGNFNYGNRLQNYALHHVLEKYCEQVETLTADNFSMGIKGKIKRYIEKRNGKYKFKRIQDLKRERSFDRFTSNNIPTKIFSTQDGKIPQSVSKEYDVFVVGSDQVWNPLFWFDSDMSSELYNYCLGFTDNKKISYAASFGVDDISVVWKKRMKPLITKFNNISVREESGIELVEELGMKAELVLDPTLLLEAKEWRKLESDFVKEKKYILTYFLGKQPDYIIDEIKACSDKQQVKIINLYDSENEYYKYGPEVFLELIDKAEVVYTDSFHAVVFSIIFHTEFVVFKRNHANQSDMSSRIRTLLRTVGIKDGLSDANIIYNSDFDRYNECLELERKKSLSFLKTALNSEI